MSTIHNLSRRSILKGMFAGGLLLGFRLGSRLGFRAASAAASASSDDLEVGLFLSIDLTGKVTILAHRSEMGTGIRTVLPLVVADELDADRSRIEISQAIGDARLGSQNTSGSKSMRRFYQPMREIGAAARAMLCQAAANRWKVPIEECRAKNHAIVHEPSARTLDFRDLVAAAAKLSVPETKDLTFKSPDQWRYVGKPVRIVDLHDMHTGAAKFGLDITPDGCRYAVIARSPVLGGKIESLDATEAKAIKGVIDVLELPAAKAPFGFEALGGAAVIADSTWAALRGCKALDIEWTKSEYGHDDYDSAVYRKQLEAAVRKPGKVVRNDGDAPALLAKADKAKTLESLYYCPHLAHATMEPPCAVAHAKDGTCEVWCPTQNPQAVQEAVAAALRLKPEQITVNAVLMGCGFGRKSKPDYAVEAALLSKRIDAPVKVTWTREDDIRHGYYHTVAAMSCQATVDGAGLPTAWLQRTAFPSLYSTFDKTVTGPGALELSLGFVDIPYAIKNLRCESCDAPNHVRIGWLRSVNSIHHAFGVCSFTDELAVAAKRDPLEYTLELIGPPRKVQLKGVEYPNYEEPIDRHPIDTGRLADVLRLCAKKAGWGKKMPAGRGLGLAVHRSFTSFVAVVADVEVTKAGKVIFHRLDIAIDCGLAVNPDRVRAQLESAVIFGAGLTLHGKITAKNGRIEQSNFRDYKMLRMEDSPKDIRTHLVESTGIPCGVGEPGVPPVAPAICAAIYQACGKRVRALPLSDHDLSWS